LITNVQEVPDTIREFTVTTVSGDKLLLRTHLHRASDPSISNKSTRSVASCLSRRVNLEEPKITIDVHSSHRRSLRYSPGNRTTVGRLYIKILNSSPEVVKSTTSEVIVTIFAPQVIDSSVLWRATKTNGLCIEANIDCNRMLTWFKEQSISALRKLAVVGRVMTTLFKPDIVNNALSIGLARGKYDNI